MATEQRILTKTDLTTITVIQRNVEATHLEPYIDIAQNIHTKELLGVALYDQLTGDVTLDTVADTYNAADTDLNNLLIKLRPSVSYWVFYEALPFLWARVTNKGLVFKNSENSQPLARTDMIELRKQVHNWAENYDNEVLTFIKNNLSLYPNFRECQDRQKHPLKYFSGIQFDNNGY